MMTFVSNVTSKALVLAVVLCAASSNTFAASQPDWRSGGDGERIILAKLQSPDFNVRHNAFYEIFNPLEYLWLPGQPLNQGKPISPAIKRGLVSLLDREAVRMAALDRQERESAHGGEITETFSDYWRDLTEIVGQLHDPAALDTLLNPIVLRDGFNNISAIGSFGEPIIPQLLVRYESSTDASMRPYLAAIFVYMLCHDMIRNQREMSTLRSIFLDLARSPDENSRLVSIRGLSFYNDAAVRERLEILAHNDPKRVTLKDPDMNYPVRREAAAVLGQWAKGLEVNRENWYP